MDKLIEKLKELLQAYAQEQNAAWRLEHNEDMGTLTAELSGWKHNEDMGTLTAELSGWKQNGDEKVAIVHSSVFYGPEDFEQDDPTAADIFEHLKKTWEDADK